MSESKEVKSSLDREFTVRLRNENPQQFHTLVRMHLSFELDLNTDDYEAVYCEKGKLKKWIRFKKTKGCVKSISPPDFKHNLTRDGIVQVRKLISFLIVEENICQEGIFRRTGSLSRQSELKSLLLHNSAINLDDGTYNVHDCASVLKGFLSDLPEPLLTDAYHPAHCQLADLYNGEECDSRESRLITAIQLLFLLLPEDNRLLLADILDMLHKTIKYESKNKMSADSLATLFTPHLVCPRNLSPEVFNAVCQSMLGIISFMIKKGALLFEIPNKLATDVRAYFVDQKRKKAMSPTILDQSITADITANTVFTFIDREKTAEAHNSNPTDTALAQLYAHIQSLPESSKKRKLIKQFNKENGQGTPLQHIISNRIRTSSAIKSSKSLGDSIKKHLFNKNINVKTPKKSQTVTGELDTPTRSIATQPKLRVLFQTPISPSVSMECLNTTKKENPQNRLVELNENQRKIFENNNQNIIDKKSVVFAEKDDSHENLSEPEIYDKNSDEDDHDEYNCDFPLFKSRYNKSEPNLNNLSNLNNTRPNKKNCFKNKLIKGVSLGNLRLPTISSDIKRFVKRNFYGNEESSSSTSLLDTDINIKTDINMKDEGKNNDNNWSSEQILRTPSNTLRDSMSPITKSTQRMPKSMQESIMTPRSRKPVIFTHNHTDSSDICDQRTKISNEITKSNEIDKKNEISPLSSVFRDYLYRRNVLSESNLDESTLSETDDCFVSKVRNLSESDMSDSLLYCLDGNRPDDLNYNMVGLGQYASDEMLNTSSDLKKCSKDGLLYCLDSKKPDGLKFNTVGLEEYKHDETKDLNIAARKRTIDHVDDNDISKSIPIKKVVLIGETAL